MSSRRAGGQQDFVAELVRLDPDAVELRIDRGGTADSGQRCCDVGLAGREHR